MTQVLNLPNKDLKNSAYYLFNCGVMDILPYLNPELQTEAEGNSTIRSENMSFANIKMHLHGMLTMWKERARDTMCSM